MLRIGCRSRLKTLFFVGSLIVCMSVYAITYVASNHFKKSVNEQPLAVSPLTLVRNLSVQKVSVVPSSEHLNQIPSVIRDKTSAPTSSPSSVITQLKDRGPLEIKEITTECPPPRTPISPENTSAKVQVEKRFSDRGEWFLTAKQVNFRNRFAEERAKRFGKRMLLPKHRIHKPYQPSIPIPADLKPEEIEHNPQMIIILAYMHTGSTYLGSIFQNHPGTFYEYEPLRSLQAETKNGQHIQFLNGTIRFVNGSRIDPVLGAWAAGSMLQCRHETLDITTLVKFYFNLENLVMRDSNAYFGCLRVSRWFDSPRPSIRHRQAIAKSIFFSPAVKTRIQRCLPHLLNKCKTSKIRVSKFIRMSMDIGELLLQQLPNLKIIHLIRDPRAMMDSQVRKGDMGTKNIRKFYEETKKMCARMSADFRLKQKLKQRFPNRIVTIRYETILKQPVQLVESLFKFTDLPFLETDMRFVEKGSLDTNKTAEVRESVWKGHLDQTHLHIINKHCSQVLEELGYNIYFEIEDIRKPDNPTYTIDTML